LAVSASLPYCPIRRFYNLNSRNHPVPVETTALSDRALGRLHERIGCRE
jgi:hypothetical protein